MIGARMLAIREELGLTQSQLTELIGGSKAMVSDYEKGRRKITYKLALSMELIALVHELGGDPMVAVNRARATNED